MSIEIKSGKEILNRFFESVDRVPGVDAQTAEVLKQLYKEGKLKTATHLSNALSELREESYHEYHE